VSHNKQPHKLWGKTGVEKLKKEGVNQTEKRIRTVKKDGKTASTLHKVQNSPLKSKA